MNWARPPRYTDPADPNDPGWWLASDGLWYPPESAPSTAPPGRSKVWIPPGAVVAPVESWGSVKFDSKKPRLHWGRGLAAVLAMILLGGAFLAVRDRSGKKDRSAAADVTTSSTTPTSKPDLADVIPSSATVVVGPSQGEKGPLDFAEAARLGDGMWADHVGARMDRNAPLLKAVEAGPALEADYGYICYAGCKGPNATMYQEFTNVPLQKSWPVAFLTTVQYKIGCHGTYSPCADTFVLQQQARNRPWKIVFWTTYSGSAQAVPEEKAAYGSVPGYAPTPGPPRIPPRELLDAYASYLDTAKRTGKPPALSIFAPGAFTSELVPTLYDPPQSQRAHGYSQRVKYRVDPADPTWVFATSQNTTLACGTVRYTSTIVGIDGAPAVQPADFSLFGESVPPGRYAEITEHGLHMVCFGFEPGTEAVFVIGSYGDDTKVETKPVH